MDFDIDLTEVLDSPTQARPEKNNDPGEETTASDNLSELEFEEVPEPIEVGPTEEVEEVPVSIYNPEENAEILVELIDTVNIQTLTPLARWKLRKKLGGKAEVTKKQLLFEKKLNSEKLTEEEKRDIELYQSYLKDKSELEKLIPYTDDEKESLKQSAIPYLKQHQIKIGGGMAFWTQLALVQGSRILQVLTA